ncbi:TPA: sugar phosphate isomerase/epimerase [bacterium]|nr:sugar phosphate isomerase/epimerase [bacterium]
MKIAYGTYATPMMSHEDSIRMMAEIGYEGVEIAISPKHIMPDSFDLSQRKIMKGVLNELGFEVPGFLMLGSVLTDDKNVHLKRLDLTKQVIEIANDLGIERKIIISTGSGGNSSMWEAKRDNLARLIDDYAKVADRYDAIIAVEPHVNAMVDRSERAIWLMKILDNPFVKLHFDIVHLFLAKEKITEAVNALLPYTAHTHVTDAIIKENGFELVPLGKGELDCNEYIKAMKEAGWADYITVEVSAMVWTKEGYDPLEVAEISYETVNKAFELAGVKKG